MYAFISGKVDSIADGLVVIDNNGIGYNVFVSSNTLTRLPKIGKTVKLFTYTYVKEDTFQLYGFLYDDEKRMFLKLININGVGCKMAMGILSGVDSATLAISIANSDVTGLSRIKGVGKKTAERIILELKEKVDIADITGIDTGSVGDDKEVNDAVAALVSLGIAKPVAFKAVMKARERTDKAEELITLALRSMDR